MNRKVSSLPSSKPQESPLRSSLERTKSIWFTKSLAIRRFYRNSVSFWHLKLQATQSVVSAEPRWGTINTTKSFWTTWKDHSARRCLSSSPAMKFRETQHKGDGSGTRNDDLIFWISCKRKLFIRRIQVEGERIAQTYQKITTAILWVKYTAIWIAIGSYRF